MRASHYVQLLKKAAQAACAAIEIYNKPGFSSREEIFSILLIQSWELLLKARILHENGNKLKSIQVFDRAASRGRRKIPKLNRAGKPMTLDLVKCMEIARQYADRNIDRNCIENILAIVEIRDNAVHYINADKALSATICYVGSACLINFLTAAQNWFGIDLDEFGFMPLPLAFYPAEFLLPLNSTEQYRSSATNNFATYLECFDEESRKEANANSLFHTRLQLDIHLASRSPKTLTSNVLAVRITRDPTAPEIRLTEEDFKAKYPWDYKKLVKEIRKKIPSMKMNATFNRVMQKLKTDPSCCLIRYLDPENIRSGKKPFYSQRALKAFEQEWLIAQS